TWRNCRPVFPTENGPGTGPSPPALSRRRERGADPHPGPLQNRSPARGARPPRPLLLGRRLLGSLGGGLLGALGLRLRAALVVLGGDLLGALVALAAALRRGAFVLRHELQQRHRRGVAGALGQLDDARV